MFELILCAVLFNYSEVVAIVKMRSVIEKETALILHEIVHSNYTSWFSLETSQTNCYCTEGLQLRQQRIFVLHTRN